MYLLFTCYLLQDCAVALTADKELMRVEAIMDV
jgi:hypothetical protein